MLLTEMVKGVPNSKYMKTRDAGVKITIEIEHDGGVTTTSVPENPQQPPAETSNTDGLVYKGYTIKQDGEGMFNVFSIGGALIDTLPSAEEAMAKINGLVVE